MNNLSKKHAFSLVEAMVAAVIFTIGVAGVFASLAAVKKPASDSDKSLGAVLCGQKLLESLRKDVDALTWDNAASNNLALTNGTPRVDVCNQNGVNYNLSYEVKPVDQNPAREVTVTVSW